MFVRLTQPPARPVQVERLGDDRLRINGLEYVVAERRAEDGFQGVALRRADSEGDYAQAVTAEGLCHCDCESFQYVAGRAARECKHLYSLRVLGFLVYELSTPSEYDDATATSDEPPQPAPAA